MVLGLLFDPSSHKTLPATGINKSVVEPSHIVVSFPKLNLGNALIFIVWVVESGQKLSLITYFTSWIPAFPGV